MQRRHPLVEVVMPEATRFVWIEHPAPETIGPFEFPADTPIPVAAVENGLGRTGWMNVPFAGRPPVPGGIEGDGSDEDVPGQELVRAFLGGHLTPHGSDYMKLVDEVGRCVLIHGALGGDQPHAKAVRDVFARVQDAKPLFDMLISRAKGRIGEGVHFLEKKDGEQALFEYLIARLLYFGAHLLSPTTSGVLYDMGVLTHDMAHQLQVDNGEGPEGWTLPLAEEAARFLRMALVDDDVAHETPARFLFGVNREVCGDLDAARQAYEAFIASPAAALFPGVSQAATARLERLQGGTAAQATPATSDETE